jgi:hypothetical protein
MTLTHEKIEARAYGLYLKRNGNGGSPLEDWLKAEKDVAKENAERSGEKPFTQSLYKHGSKAPGNAGKS